MSFIIRGVHPIHAPEPCHLIEVELTDPDSLDWGIITQEISGQPRENWQVVWDERPLDRTRTRWVFFFHYLDLAKPLLTPVGNIKLPDETPVPNHLSDIEYESPG